MFFAAALSCKMNNYDPKAFQSTMDLMYAENGFPTVKFPRQIMTKEYIDVLAPFDLPYTNDKNLRSLTQSKRSTNSNSQTNKNDISFQPLDAEIVSDTIQQSFDLFATPDDAFINNNIAQDLARENESLPIQSSPDDAFNNNIITEDLVRENESIPIQPSPDMFASHDDAITNINKTIPEALVAKNDSLPFQSSPDMFASQDVESIEHSLINTTAITIIQTPIESTTQLETQTEQNYPEETQTVEVVLKHTPNTIRENLANYYGVDDFYDSQTADMPMSPSNSLDLQLSQSQGSVTDTMVLQLSQSQQNTADSSNESSDDTDPYVISSSNLRKDKINELITNCGGFRVTKINKISNKDDKLIPGKVATFYELKQALKDCVVSLPLRGNLTLSLIEEAIKLKMDNKYTVCMGRTPKKPKPRSQNNSS